MIEQVVDGATSFGSVTYQLSQGVIQTVGGVRLWSANAAKSAQSPTRFRIFFESGGKAYMGVFTKAARPNFTIASSGVSTDMTVRYNDAAV